MISLVIHSGCKCKYGRYDC